MHTKSQVQGARRTASWSLAVGALAACLATALAGCGSPAKSAGPPTATPVATRTPARDLISAQVALAAASRSPMPAAAPARSTTTVTVRLWSRKGGEFLAPGTISCEIDNGYVSLHQVDCQTITPPESVTLSPTGKLKKCVGPRCIGNPADNAVNLPYGSSTSAGPFHCLSTKPGVICTVSGKGFRISKSGIVAWPIHTK
jgi:hypothetical protein